MQADPWVCPWGICNHEQAQQCRATFGEWRYGIPHGCGSKFPVETTSEQAKALTELPGNAGVSPSSTTQPEN